jgi:hypothetical protein
MSNEQINIDVILNTSKVSRDFNKMEQLGRSLAVIGAKGIDVSKVVNNMQRELSKAPALMQGFNHGIARGQKEVLKLKNQFDMAFLSIMFAGMYMDKFGKSLVSLVLPAMGRFADFQHKGVKAVNAMNASIEFLKFSLFDAFSQTDVFRLFIEYTIKAADWVSDFVGKSPGWAIGIAAVGAAFVLVGKSLLLTAEMYTGIRAIKDIAAFFGAGGTGASAAGNVDAFAKGLAGLGGVLLIAYSLKMSYDILTDDQTSLGQRVGLMLAASMGGALLGFAVAGPGGAAVGFAIGFTVSALVNVADIAFESTAKLNEARKSMGMDEMNWVERLMHPITANVDADERFIKYAEEKKKREEEWKAALERSALAQDESKKKTDVMTLTLAGQLNPALAISKTYWDDVKIAMDNFKVALENFKPKPIVVYVDYVERNKPGSVSGLKGPTSPVASDKYTNSVSPAPKPFVNTNNVSYENDNQSRTKNKSAFGY